MDTFEVESDLEGLKDRNDEDESDAPAFPYAQTCALAFVCFSNAYGTCFVFSIVGYMVVDFGAAETVDKAGYFAGFIASSFMFGRVCSSPLWGWVSDKYGRKLVIVCGCVSVTVFCLAFGLVESLPGVMAIRLLHGLTNGITATSQTMASEISDGQFATSIMTVITSCWSLGLVVGPSLSSILARPAKEYPSLFDGESLVAKKAYLLPSLVPATLGALSLVVAIKWLPEPGHSHANQAQYVSVPVAEDSEDIQNIKNGSLESPEEVSKVLPGEPVFSLTMDMVVTNGLYSSLSFIEVMVDEVVPLWAISSGTTGGLDMRLPQIGTLIAFGGFLMLGYQLFGYNRIARSMKLTTMFRYTCICVGVFLLIEPAVVSWLYQRQNRLWFWVLFILNGCRVAITSGGFTTICVLSNNAVPREFRGRVNGVGMAVASVFMMIAPSFGAVVFATSIHSEHLNFYFTFLLAAGAAFSSALISYTCLSQELNETR